jgi:hypothetical protein
LLDEILECLVLLTAYVGIPRTLSAIEVVRCATKEAK